ncbi:glycosyltransferase family 4 protein [Methyloferula stellata]|uniref:glycosyltransferase family 4 protein n=1 Tax=Methyloferula stellata TaxID=876270 RepID=UPI000380409B|nr:glycosyltransferase family 4 protein [Methyloferula stellata]
MHEGSSSFADRSAHQLAGFTILQILPELSAGGAEQTTIDIAAALAEAGARALVASESGRLVSELQAKGGIWVPFPAKTKNPIAMALHVRRLAKLIRAEHVDIVHARSRAPAWVAHGATRLTKTPFVTTFHGSYSGKAALKQRYNSIMAQGDMVIANSHYTADLIAKLYPEAVPKTKIIYRGIDLRAFSPSAIDPMRVQAVRREWGVAPDERIVLLAARLSPWKGHKLLIAAAKQLVESGLSDTKFIFAGDPQGRNAYVREIDQEIEKAHLQNIVRRVGHWSDMPAAHLAAAVVVVPSTEPEAFGRVTVEAQAMGTPVVVTDLGAASETVLAPPEVEASGRTGWRVPPHDARALADVIGEALNYGASARDMLAFRSRTFVQTYFSVDRMCSETLAAYVALLAQRV